MQVAGAYLERFLSKFPLPQLLLVIGDFSIVIGYRIIQGTISPSGCYPISIFTEPHFKGPVKEYTKIETIRAEPLLRRQRKLGTMPFSFFLRRSPTERRFERPL
jgi:hypothetical protein